jgi:hypothetical protein
MSAPPTYPIPTLRVQAWPDTVIDSMHSTTSLDR